MPTDNEKENQNGTTTELKKFVKKYTDEKNGTYVNPEGQAGDISLVSNPNGNEWRDESHRDMSDEEFRPRFSNLDKTFMFSSRNHKGRENFWGAQYSQDHSYKNSNADIDDPIFTGFTLSIDKLNSPLFYTIGEYDGAASGRKTSGGRTLSRNIADEIENCLRNNYSSFIRGSINSYDIAAILTKDKFPNGDEIGYGMQHNIYVDGIPYGATEYIYMVDKLIEDFNTSQDQDGHFSLGDGSKTYGAADDITVGDYERLLSDEGKLQGEMTNYESKLNDNELKKKHEALEKAKTDLEDEIAKKEIEITALNDQIKYAEGKTGTGVGAQIEKTIENKMRDLLTNIRGQVTNLKPTGDKSSHSKEEYDEICNKINEYDSKLQEIVRTYDGKPEEADKLVNSSDKGSVKVTKCEVKTTEPANVSDYEKLPIDNSSETFNGIEAYRKGGKYNEANLKITVTVEKTGESDTTDADIKKRVEEYRKKLENLQKEVDDIKTKKLPEATAAYNEDEYTTILKNYEQARRDYQAVEESLDLIKNDITVMQNGSQRVSDDAELYTGDFTPEKPDEFNFQNEYTKKALADAPQTVYDMLGFINGMTRLTTVYPYLMQSITGLDEAYKNNYGVKDSFRGSGDNKITINIYESLDLKVSGMFNKYFNAVYDAQYRRERVPVNLRRFNCSVFVHDIRNFKMMTTAVGKTIRSMENADKPKIAEVALNTMSAIEFKFFGCEIVPEETGSIFENVSNAERGDMRMTNFTFTYSDCVINYLPFEDLKNSFLKNVSHTPYAEKPNRVGGKSPEELRFKGDKKAYEMTSEEFDSRKGKLNGIEYELIKESNTKKDGKTGEQYNTVPVPGGSKLGDVIGKTGNPEILSEIPDKADVSGKRFEDMDITASFEGNVYDDNREYTADERNPETVLHSVFDRTGLGNVNNDDFIEYADTMMSRNRYTAVKDMNMQAAANINAMSSVYDNYTQSQEDFHRLFDRLATSVSASTGLSKENVYKEYIEEIENIVFPGRDTKTVDNLNNIYPVQKETPKQGYIDDVLPDDEPGEKPSDLGNVYPDLSENPVVSDIDDVYPDLEPKPNIEELDNVYPKMKTPDTQGYIDDVLPDDPDLPDVGEIGNVYPDLKTPGKQGYIGDVLPDDKMGPEVENIGNVYPKTSEPHTQGYIDDVIPDEKRRENINDIGNVYRGVKNGETVTYIDDVIPDDKNGTNVGDLGNIYPGETKNNTVTNAGKVSLEDTTREILMKLDKLSMKKDGGRKVERL